MTELYAPIKPYAQHKLAVESPHLLYVEECGNPEGIPIVYVHGGPGCGCDADSRRFFNPHKYRIICFDQRGCGRSLPRCSLQNNTTQALIQDLEVIREKLGISQWVLFGGSWGSTLSLVYAQAHPQRVKALILRGIFLGREEDFAWTFKHGMSAFFPDYWTDFLKPIPLAERDNLYQAYYRRLTGTANTEKHLAAKAWYEWESRCALLQTTNKPVQAAKELMLATATLECHYALHHSFLAENQLLAHCDVLHKIPGVIIHGRYDMICRIQQAYELHEAWKPSSLVIVPDAGHSAREPGILEALVGATDNYH